MRSAATACILRNFRDWRRIVGICAFNRIPALQRIPSAIEDYEPGGEHPDNAEQNPFDREHGGDDVGAAAREPVQFGQVHYKPWTVAACAVTRRIGIRIAL